MARDRKCILCETVCSSRQEMEEHIRSMLHHRELEKLKGRDCGHECRVCRVTLESLTDYANHISGPSHKQKVEAADRKPARKDRDEDYFDQALVDLVQKRKDHIRREKEAAAAKQAKEEEERKKKEAFQQRLRDAKDQYRRDCGWQQPSHRFGGPGHHKSWYNRDGGSPREQPWRSDHPGRSATWHAQDPPHMRRWESGEFVHNQEWRGNRTWGQGSLPQKPQSRLPWLSSGGSSNGLYGRNNISQLVARGPPVNLSAGPSKDQPWPNFFSKVFNHFPNAGNSGPQNGESDHRPQGSKTFGTSPKPDKVCRWSPYSFTKGPESGSCSDTGQNPSEKQPNGSRPRQPEKEPEPSGFNRPSRPEQRLEQTLSQQSTEDKGKLEPTPTTKLRDGSSSRSRSNSSQRDRPQVLPALPQKTKKPSPQTPELGSAPVSKLYSQVPTKSTSTQTAVKLSGTGPLKKSSSERQLQKPVKKAKQSVLEKRSSLDSSRMEIGEEQQKKDQSLVGVNKENSCLQKPPTTKSSDCCQNLQSLHVSTSTTETSEVSAPPGVRQRNRVEKQASSEAPDETGHSSENDASKSGEALAVPGLSRLDLPPVLKRDLTKHISSKSKAVCHEPNLNIARRVRNLSESRRSDSEKDSGLKPTVRQLISSSGSRRNVNWEQVYQEVRKKQDQGKGMPRFGIEMVPCEQEYHSMEEEDIPLLEGFQWESLMDLSSQSASRKRSLSESSVAPAFAPSLFSPAREFKKATTENEELSAERRAPAPPSSGETQEVKTEVSPSEATPYQQQRSDSALGDSSSGAEQLDGQGTAKRRRAAVDLPAAESSGLEHSSKRRKVRCRKERLQIDQLLSVSLREDELSRSLQTVDTSLVQARAAMEAAYMEVQRLMVVKQQMTDEMSSLRNRRIELLQGMKDTVTEAPQPKPKEETTDSVNLEPLGPSSIKPAAPCVLSAPSPPPPPPPAPAPLVIKEEPRSPVHISSPLHLTDWAHSTTLELPVYGPEPDLSFHPSPQNKAEQNQSPDHREAPPEVTKMEQDSLNAAPPESTFSAGLQVFQCPASPPDPKTGKRVRKLKKRKTLKKSPGLEQPESTDTELDEEASRPRWLRSRRRASGGSQVSTSSLTPEEKTPIAAEPQDQMEVCTEPQAEAPVPDTTRPESQSLACNEVSSTSDMDLCRSSESDMPLSVTLLRNSSDASSDHGEDDLPSEGPFDGHQEAVNAMQIHDGLLYTCSGDRTVKAFDLLSRQCVGVFEGHSSKVSCLLVSAAPSLHHRLYSGSSDQTIRCYNLKTRELEQLFSLPDRVLCLHSRWKTLFAGLANGTVVTFNLKTNRQMDVFECHGPRAVSCLASSQEGARRVLLVGSYDNTISVRDAKNGLLLRLLEGHGKTVLCMKVVNDLVFSGSSDQCVHTHNIHTGELLRVYKGHSHAVTVVIVLGNVMVTACLDKLVRVYDLQSQEQLQVYSGHTDMVMCMAVHRNMIYTGCYDGTVRAVKLNLMQNSRCQWHGCSLVFGLTDHLQQHLINDHSGSSPTLKCRWRNCEEFFGSRGSKQGKLLLHLQRHAAEEAQVK
ncbi:unnamed protein product [Ophioblennius macclurei]